MTPSPINHPAAAHAIGLLATPVPPPPPGGRRGPKTPEGKARSSQNSRKHGLYSKKPQPAEVDAILAQHAPVELSELLRLFTDEYQPCTDYERSLVDILAGSVWRMRATWAAENAMFGHPYFHPAPNPQPPSGSALLLIDAMGRADQRSFRKFLQTERLLSKLPARMETKPICSTPISTHITENKP